MASKWIVCCACIEGIRRGKTLFGWERKALGKGNYHYIIANSSDTITLTDVKGIEYNILVLKIPTSDVPIPNIQVKRNDGTKVWLYDISVYLIDINKNESEENYHGFT